jgi:PAS domain S-box-containing protein
MFGYQPGSVVTSHELFLRQVHASDRPAVVDWISQALRHPGRTAFEFRIDRPDGSVRRVRSTGRALSDEQGHVVWMVGVIEDVTEQEHAPPTPVSGMSFSARQVAHILGVAQVTVKRLAASGEIRSLRSSRKNSQRFAPGDVVDYLRSSTTNEPFEDALESRNIAGCIVHLLDQVLAGTALETLLDEHIRPAARVAPAAVVGELLSRLPYLVPEPARSAFPALLVEVGAVRDHESTIIACLLRASGHEVLRPAVAPDVADLGELAERVRSRFVVMTVGNAPPLLQQRGLAAASAIANSRSAASTVCLHGEDHLRVPRGVFRFRTMTELAAILRR